MTFIHNLSCVSIKSVEFSIILFKFSRRYPQHPTATHVREVNHDRHDTQKMSKIFSGRVEQSLPFTQPQTYSFAEGNAPDMPLGLV